VARLAGDEFTIVLEGVRDAADAKALRASWCRRCASR